MICKKCGCRVDDAAKFCNKCGASMEEFGEQEVQKNGVQIAKKEKRIIVGVILLFICCIGGLLTYRNGWLLKPNERYVLWAAREAKAQTEFPKTFQLERAFVKNDEDDSDGQTSVCLVYSALSEMDNNNMEATVEFTFALVTVHKFGKCTYTDESTVMQQAYEKSADSQDADSIARGYAALFEMNLQNVISTGEEVAVDKINEMI